VWYQVQPKLFSVPVTTVTAEELKSLKPGTAVMAMPFICKNQCLADGSFTTIPGTLRSVKNPHAITYDMSTDFGYCRAAVAHQNGKVLCGHWMGRSREETPRPGGSLSVFENDTSQWHVADFDEKYYKVAPQALSCLECLDTKAFSGFEESKKVWKLRTDLGTMRGLATQYTMMKPSTEMNRRELQKFAEPVVTKEDDLEFAKEMLLVYDRTLSRPARTPTKEDVDALVRALSEQDKSAGPGGRGDHRQYITKYGGGDMEAGVRLMAEHAWDYIATGGHPVTNGGAAFASSLNQWAVLGKTDGYKARKMDIGRTIQAPTFELKLLHLVYFSEEDTAWIGRMKTGEPAWVYAGHDMDMPISEKRIATYAKAKSALSLDMKGFDRRMQAEYIAYHFEYLNAMYPGIPLDVMADMYAATVESKMYLTNGECYVKRRGNPSGYPNTLRLNCCVNMMCWLECLRCLLELPMDNPLEAASAVQANFHIEICGDDSRVWALTDVGYAALQHARKFWEEHFPWEITVEGEADFTTMEPTFYRLMAAPPMVSRAFTLATIGGQSYLFEPLADPSRCLRKLLHSIERPPDKQEDVLRSVTTNVALLWYQVCVMGTHVSAQIQAFHELFVAGDPVLRDRLLNRVAVIWSVGIPKVPALSLQQ
jgi:hypothetical protein